jgi:hypothetical protein
VAGIIPATSSDPAVTARVVAAEATAGILAVMARPIDVLLEEEGTVPFNDGPAPPRSGRR